MDKYGDAIGKVEVKVSVKEILNEDSVQKVDDRIKKQKADIEKPVEISVKSDAAVKQLKELTNAAKQVKENLQEAVSAGKDFKDLYKLVSNYEKLSRQIKQIAPSVAKNNAALKEGNKVLRETKTIVDKLLGVEQKPKKTRNKTGTKQELDDTKALKDAVKDAAEIRDSAEKTAVRTQQQVNKELEKELQLLKEIEEQERRNDAARERFKKIRSNYGKEVLGVDHAVYDTDLLKGAAKELKEFNELLDTRNKYQEKYAKLCNIIERYYIDDTPGKYSVGNGMYKNLDKFFDLTPDMKKLEELFENGQKTTNKSINEMFKNVVRDLQNQGRTVMSLLSSGDVSGDIIGQRLDAEEIKLNKEMQRLYDARQDQLRKINALRQEELDLIKQAGQEEDKKNNVIKKTDDTVVNTQIQDNKKLISSYGELIKVMAQYINLAKQIKPESTKEYDEVVEDMRSATLFHDDDVIAEIKAAYKTVKNIKSSQKAGLSVYKGVNADGTVYEDKLFDDTLQEAERKLRGYIYNAADMFGLVVEDVVKNFGEKRLRTFVENQINKYIEINDSDDAYRIEAQSFNLPIQEAIDEIVETIMLSVNDIDKTKVQDILDSLRYRVNDVNRYTFSRELNSIGGYVGISTPDEEIRANAKKIKSYEELCDVIERYNKFKGRSVIYGGNDSPGLNEEEEKERIELSARLVATGGEDIWKLSDFGEFKDIDKLATTLGIEIPKAVDTATSANNKLESSYDNLAETMVGLSSASNEVNATSASLAVPNTTSDIVAATDAIYEEGVVAEQAASKKDKFTEANKRVAQSGKGTKDGIDDASGAMENEGKSAKQYADEVINAITRMNSLNKEIDTLGAKNKGGIFSSQIDSMQQEKSSLFALISSIAQEVNSKFKLGFSAETVGANSLGVIAEFFKKAGESAAISGQDVTKFVDILRTSEKVAAEVNNRYQETSNRINNLRESISGFYDGVSGSSGVEKKDDGSSDYYDKSFDKYVEALNKYDVLRSHLGEKSVIDFSGEEHAAWASITAEVEKYGNVIKHIQDVEREYFAGKQQYIAGDTTMSSMAEDAENAANKTNKAKQSLVDAANEFAQESGAGGAIITKFVQGANGIAKLDFAVLDQGTNTLRKFTLEAGRASDSMYVTENTVNKFASRVQTAVKQLDSASELITKLGHSGINLDADSATPKISKFLNLYKQLSDELNKGDGADQNTITRLTGELKIACKEIENTEAKMRKMASAIESGQAIGFKQKIDPNGDIYGQLAVKAQEFATINGNATLQLGKFDAATNTLNASLLHANGTVEQFKVSMYGLDGSVAAQQAGVTKLTTSWDSFKSIVAGAGKKLMTALVGYNVFYKAISEVRKGVGYVKEIDLALTELKKVTDETEESYRKFLDTAADSAGKIGSTVSDFTEASANFARLGYTMEESAQMAETAIVYKNVADGLDTVDAATESIISTMKAFGIESDDTMGIIDRFNEVKVSCLLIQ